MRIGNYIGFYSILPREELASRVFPGKHMSIIRWLLGSLILLLNWVFTPRSIKRDVRAQAAIDEQTGRLTLYQYKACPFCV